MTRPLVFGYVQAVLTDAGLPRREVSARKAIEAFADGEDFTAAQVFVDIAGASRLIALESLLEATSFTVVAAVVVPHWGHLVLDRTDQAATERRIFESTGVPVLSVAVTPPRVTPQAARWRVPGVKEALCSTA